MAYCTQADVQNAIGGEERLRQASDWARGNAIGAANVADAIAEADGLIDSYAKKVHAVPFNPVPEQIKRTSANLAKLILKRRRGMLSADDARELEMIAGPDGWLVQLSQGKVVTGAAAEPAKSELTVDAAHAADIDNEADRSKFEGYS